MISPDILAMPFGFILIGIIWSLALGFAAGNYACSVVHRLPRARGMLEKKPYCGNCGTMLATKDLFPVVSALLLRHRCRYCRAPIPMSHFWTEVLVGALFVLSYLQFNFSESFILTVFLGTFLVILASIENNEGFLQGRVMVAIIVIAMIARTLWDGSIYGFFAGGFFGMIAGGLVWRKGIRKVGHWYQLPPGAQLCTIGGVCAGTHGLPLFLLAFLALGALGRAMRSQKPDAKPLPLSVPFGLAAILPVLYPQLALALNAIFLPH